MKISIITPSFNQVRYLPRTLESVLSQSGDFSLDLIVIDGGSTDGSADVLARYADRLRYVSEPDRGQSHAINKGLAMVDGEVISWLNSDDLLLPGALGRVADYFSGHPETAWAYGRCIVTDEEDREIRRGVTAYKNFLGRSFSRTKLVAENFINQPATFFRRGLIERAGPVDESLHYTMDYELWLRFSEIAEPGRIDADLAAFRFHRAAKTGGAYVESLKEANGVSRRYAEKFGKPWIGTFNYWWYYKRTVLIYRLLERAERNP